MGVRSLENLYGTYCDDVMYVNGIELFMVRLFGARN